MLAFFIICIFLTPMLWACVTDFMSMTIPNWISIFIVCSYFVVAPLVWQGWADFGTHVSVGLTTFAVCLFLFAIGGFGGGDAKLLAATSVWWVWQDMVVYIMASAVAGGVLALMLMLGRKWMPAGLMANKYLARQFRYESKMPYGLALAAGAIMTLPESSIFMHATGV